MIPGTLWFNEQDEKYEGPEPSFFSAADIEVAAYLENNYDTISKQLQVLWDKKKIGGQGDFLASLDIFDDKQYPPLSWQKIVMYACGLKNRSAFQKFPFVTDLTSRYSNIISCIVSKTAAHSIIRPHSGEMNAHFRIQLALNVPSEDPQVNGIAVGCEIRGWQNGKTLVFLDAHEHHVWNKADTDRYLLIVDVIRPEFARRKNYICIRLISYKLLTGLKHKLRFSNPAKVPYHLISITMIMLYIPIQTTIFLNNLLLKLGKS